MSKLNHKKIAIYIDTSSLYGGKLFDNDGILFQLKQLIDLVKSNDDLLLLKNDIIEYEIKDKLSLPNLKKHFTAKQIQEVSKIFEANKDEYQKTVYNLFSLGKDFKINLSHDDIIDGVGREYKKESPWGRGKENEWKDFVVQKALINYINLDEYKPIILTNDKDFKNMVNHGFDVKKMPLKAFLSYLKLYLEDKNNFEVYLINKIYSDIEYDIMDRVLEMADLDETFVGIENDDEPEITIEDIQILDIKDIKRIQILVKADIYGFVGNYHVDDNRGEVYGIKSNKLVEYKMICSFEGEYNHQKFFEDQMSGMIEDSNIVKLI